MSEIKTIKLFQVPRTAIELAEIDQYMDIKFAFLNADYEQVIRPCKCRDFLGDMLWSRATGNNVQIYNMKYSYAENPYDINVTRFSLKFPRKDAMENFIKNFHFLTEKEVKYGVTPSVWFNTDQPLTLVIEGSPIWQSNNWKLSLYTFYIKCMGYPELGDYKGPEYKYQQYLTQKREEALLSNLKLEFNDTIQDLYRTHNDSGFVHLITATSYEVHPARHIILKDVA